MKYVSRSRSWLRRALRPLGLVLALVAAACSGGRGDSSDNEHGKVAQPAVAPVSNLLVRLVEGPNGDHVLCDARVRGLTAGTYQVEMSLFYPVPETPSQSVLVSVAAPTVVDNSNGKFRADLVENPPASGTYDVRASYKRATPYDTGSHSCTAVIRDLSTGIRFLQGFGQATSNTTSVPTPYLTATSHRQAGDHMVCQSRLNYANPSTDYVVSIGTQTGSGSYSWTIPAPSSTPVIGPLFPINDGTLLIERGVAKWSPAVPSLSVRFDFIRPVGIFTGNRTCSFTVQEAVTGTVVLSEMTQMSTSICGDGIVDDTEPCDPFAPATPCCSEDCFGPAPGWQPCGADPDGDGCQAAPTCDGSGWNASACEASLVPDGIPCTDDSLFCTGAEICQSGNCQSSGNPCPGPNGNANCAESCNEVAETCSAPDPDGSPCDDGLLCAGDACQGGACIPDLTCL